MELNKNKSYLISDMQDGGEVLKGDTHVDFGLTKTQESGIKVSTMKR